MWVVIEMLSVRYLEICGLADIRIFQDLCLIRRFMVKFQTVFNAIFKFAILRS